jgi:hypothetical protein
MPRTRSIAAKDECRLPERSPPLRALAHLADKVDTGFPRKV